MHMSWFGEIHLSTNRHLCALLAPLPRNNCKEASVLRLFVVEQGEDTEQARIRGWTEYRGKVPRGWVEYRDIEKITQQQEAEFDDVLPSRFGNPIDDGNVTFSITEAAMGMRGNNITGAIT